MLSIKKLAMPIVECGMRNMKTLPKESNHNA
jgi:hypothetical protein